MTRAKTIRVATFIGFGLAVFGNLACRSADKIEEIEPASVSQVTSVESPARVEPIRLEEDVMAREPFELSGAGSRQFVFEDDDLKLSEIRATPGLPVGTYRIENGQWGPVLINGRSPPGFIMDIQEFNDDYFWSRFAKPGARFSPDIIHDRTWEEERKGVLLAPPPGK